MLFLSLAVVIKPVAGGATVVKVDPPLIEYYEDATGQQFTVAIKIVDVTNLYGFDIKFRWNTTFLDYVSDSVHVPKNITPDGVLYSPLIFSFVQVNATTGTYWVAYSSRYPAPSFNGSGTVFNMTLRIKQQPVQPQPDAHITLELYSTDLADKGGGSIPHSTQHGTVILYALSVSHDIAITNVKPLKTVVGQTFSCKINVTVQNQGQSTETFNVTAYADLSLPIGNEITIGKQTVVNLLVGETRALIYLWNTTSRARGNYTISAYATPVQSETDTADNTFVDGWLVVTVSGDLTGDYRVNYKDLGILAVAYGSDPTKSSWNPQADINDDGKVNYKDLGILAVNYGKYQPP